MADIAELGVKVTSTGIEQADAGLVSLERNMSKAESTSSGLTSTFGGMNVKAIAAGAAITAGAAAVTKLTSEIVQAQIQIDKLNRGFTTLTGSSSLATLEINKAKDIAAQLGLAVGDVTNAYLKWSGAIKGTALEGAAGTKVFSTMARAASNLGLSADETNGIMLALSQIASKGTVSMEELRGQLGERLPGAMQIAARSMGVTTAELDKLVSSGKVGAETFLLGFSEQVEKEIGGGTKQIEGMQASINAFGNAFTARMQAIADSGAGKALAALIKGMADIMSVETQAQKDTAAYQREVAELAKLEKQLDAVNKAKASGAANSDILNAKYANITTRITELRENVANYNQEVFNTAQAEKDAIQTSKDTAKANEAKKIASDALAKAQKDAAKAEKDRLEKAKELLQAQDDEILKLTQGEAALKRQVAMRTLKTAAEIKAYDVGQQIIGQLESEKKAREALDKANKEAADLYEGKMKSARVSYLTLTGDYIAQAMAELNITDANSQKVREYAAALERASAAKKTASQATKIDEVRASIQFDISQTGTAESPEAKAKASLDALRKTNEERMSVIQAAYDLENAKAMEQADSGIISQESAQEKMLAAESNYLRDKENLHAASAQRIAMTQRALQQQQFASAAGVTSMVAQTLGNMAQIAEKGGKEQFQRYKNLQMANAAVSAAAAVLNVLATPGISPFVSIPLSVSIGALAAANIAQIRQQEYQGRATGGDFLGGTSYKVNERGQEIITTREGGNIISSERVLQALSRGGDSGGIIINNYTSGTATARQSNGLTIIEVREIARDTISSDIQNGGNQVSSAFENTYAMRR